MYYIKIQLEHKITPFLPTALRNLLQPSSQNVKPPSIDPLVQQQTKVYRIRWPEFFLRIIQPIFRRI